MQIKVIVVVVVELTISVALRQSTSPHGEKNRSKNPTPRSSVSWAGWTICAISVENAVTSHVQLFCLFLARLRLRINLSTESVLKLVYYTTVIVMSLFLKSTFKSFGES